VIVKRNLRPSRTLAYTWRELAFVGCVATAACVLRIEHGVSHVALPFGPLGVRDLRDQLGEAALPPAAAPVDGYLY
jgi:hypothetical protein